MMMQVAFQDNPRDFLNKCGDYLRKNEIEHNLIFTLCERAEQKIKRGEKADINFSLLYEDDDLVLAAARTGASNLVLSKATSLEIEKLAETLAEEQINLPGIVGPSDVAAAFANKWTQLTGRRSVEYMDQLIYSAKYVTLPSDVRGQLRLARADEAPLISAWIEAFSKDVLPKTEHRDSRNDFAKASEMIAAGRVFVWDVDGTPVSQVGIFGTEKIARISLLYTPPEHRGHGYAGAAIAHLSKQQLDMGKDLCCLYADARNPVSNSIYRKIGYEFVGRSSLYVLEKA